MQVIDILSVSGNTNMKKMTEFLKNECLKEVISKNGFPVKVQIPIGMIVKATVTFGKFEFINEADFSVPIDCRIVSRKEGMKTMESKKKRLAVANVIS
jgi:hypothetical protein